jgi:hypothetical protein
METPEEICPDFPEWPNRWSSVKKDIPYGQGVLDSMRAFLVDLISRGLTKRTIRTHLDNLWLLGGEIIRSVSMFDQYNIPPEENLRRNVDEEGGPYCAHLLSESQQRSYDATCRKLHKYLEANGQTGPSSSGEC